MFLMSFAKKATVIILAIMMAMTFSSAALAAGN